MPANRKPKAWNLKPQLTAAPEFWQENRLLVGYQEGVGVPRDLSPYRHSISVGDNAPVWTVSNMGKATEATGTNNEWVVADKGAWDDLTDEYTVFGVAKHADETGGNFHLLNWGHLTAGSIIVRTFDRGIEFLRRDNNNTQESVDISVSTHDLAAGDDYAFVCRAIDSSSTNMWLDIKNISTGNIFRTSISVAMSGGLKSGAGNLYLLNHPSANVAYEYPVYLTGIAHEKWNDEKADRFFNDPFAMLRPAGF